MREKETGNEEREDRAKEEETKCVKMVGKRRKTEREWGGGGLREGEREGRSKGERERKAERQRETDRQTDRQKDKQMWKRSDG